MNKDLSFSGGVADARMDLDGNWIPSDDHLTLDFIVSQLRSMSGASDSYIAGYLSVVYNPTK